MLPLQFYSNITARKKKFVKLDAPEKILEYLSVFSVLISMSISKRLEELLSVLSNFLSWLKITWDE